MSNPPGAPAIVCVLINWNHWRDTDACLTSLAAQDYPNLRVLVVDNASTNDSLAQLRAAHPWVTYVENHRNYGFPKACNIGARHPFARGAEFLWLLNNDTIVPPATASKLVAKALSNHRAGIIGAVLRYMHAPGTIQAWGGGTVNLWTGYSTHFTGPSHFGPESYLTFASVLIRREVFDAVQGLFEGAFMYFEDSDFCLRARAAGWQLAVAEDTAILHKEGGSATPRHPTTDRIMTYSGLAFLQRHSPAPTPACALFLLTRVLRRALRADWPAVQAVLAGAGDWRRKRPFAFADAS